jgi:hypothetical protein
MRPLSIHESFAGRHVLLTGASGFFGKVWLAMVLHRVPESARSTCSCAPRRCAAPSTASSDGRHLARLPRPARALRRRSWAEFISQPRRGRRGRRLAPRPRHRRPGARRAPAPRSRPHRQLRRPRRLRPRPARGALHQRRRGRSTSPTSPPAASAPACSTSPPATSPACAAAGSTSASTPTTPPAASPSTSNAELADARAAIDRSSPSTTAPSRGRRAPRDVLKQMRAKGQDTNNAMLVRNVPAPRQAPARQGRR